MKRFAVALALVGIVLAHSAAAQSTADTTYCGGAEGNSKACALGCSGTRVNDEVVSGSNQGTFNVGNGNQGDGNDGFNNAGNFNVGSGNTGNCNLQSGGIGGTCDPSNANGQIVLRFCRVYPSNNRCQPGGYLPEFSAALTAQLPAIVGSCAGVIPTTPTTPVSPPGTPPAPMAMGPGGEPVVPVLPMPPSVLSSLPKVSDSTADLGTLLTLLDEHIRQEKAGRKLKL